MFTSSLYEFLNPSSSKLVLKIDHTRKKEINELLGTLEEQILKNKKSINDDNELSFGNDRFNINNSLHQDVLSFVRVGLNQNLYQIKLLDRKTLLCSFAALLTLSFSYTLPFVFVPLSIVLVSYASFLVGKRQTLDSENGAYTRSLNALCYVYIWIMNDPNAVVKNDGKQDVNIIDGNFSQFAPEIKKLLHEIFPLLSKKQFLSYTRNDQYDTDIQIYEHLENKFTYKQGGFSAFKTALERQLYAKSDKQERNIFSTLLELALSPIKTMPYPETQKSYTLER